MGLKLGFHYHIPALSSNGQIYMPGYLGRFIDSLAVNCESLTCFMHSPLQAEIPQMDYKIQSKNVDLVGLGPHNSLPVRVTSFYKYRRVINGKIGSLDCMLLRGPSPLLPMIANACKPLPLALLLVGDQLAGVDGLPQPRWRKEVIRQFWLWNSKKQLEVAKKNLTFVNSHLLFTQLSKQVANLIETRTTTLTKEDIYIREDACDKPPYHILYVGRMDRTKGILDILEAIALLTEEGMDLIYELVGPENRSEPVLSEMVSRARELGISDRVFYHGYKTVGPELFSYYRSADIYIIASQSSSEGFPRTIWEAMANGLPVIATKVGSIPDFISDAAVLVAANRPVELSTSIRSVIESPVLRRANVLRGYELASQNTLEIQSSLMVDIINEVVLGANAKDN